MEVGQLGALVGLAGGLLIIGVGAFVWRARPGGLLHRAFFAFAAVDGLSTVARRASLLTTDPALRGFAVQAYWWTFIPFVAALAAFSLAFPRPLGGAPRRRVVVGIPLAAAAALLLLHAFRPDLFWELSLSPTSAYRFGPLGILVTILFIAASGAALLKLAHEIRAAVVETQRRQAAIVLAGLALLCAPFPLGAVGTGLAAPATMTDGGAIDATAHAVAALFACAYAFCLASLASHARALPAREGRLLIVTLAIVALSLPVAYVAPSHAFLGALRGAGLLAYPILLAYAIVRYEIFDIDARIRRALTLPLLGACIAAVFFAIEVLVSNYLEDRLAGRLSSTFASALVAGVGAVLVAWPLSRLVKAAVRAVLPHADADSLRARALEIYRHSVAGALADGEIQAAENRALAALRESLRISGEEHERIVLELRGAAT